jgi:hypothetical protein
MTILGTLTSKVNELISLGIKPEYIIAGVNKEMELRQALNKIHYEKMFISGSTMKINIMGFVMEMIPCSDNEALKVVGSERLSIKW